MTLAYWSFAIMKPYVVEHSFGDNVNLRLGKTKKLLISTCICVVAELTYCVLSTRLAFSENLKDDKAASELVWGLDKHKNVSELDDLIKGLRRSQNVEGLISQIKESVYFVSLNINIKYRTFPDRYTDLITLANSGYIVRIYIDRSAQPPILDMSGAKAKKTDDDYSISQVDRDQRTTK